MSARADWLASLALKPALLKPPSKNGCPRSHLTLFAWQDELVSGGYLAAGYTGIHIDDCWMQTNPPRNAQGELQVRCFDVLCSRRDFVRSVGVPLVILPHYALHIDFMFMCPLACSIASRYPRVLSFIPCFTLIVRRFVTCRRTRPVSRAA